MILLHCRQVRSNDGATKPLDGNSNLPSGDGHSERLDGEESEGDERRVEERTIMPKDIQMARRIRGERA